MRDWIYGIDRKVPLLDGSMVRYVNLDNAASTPPLKRVVEGINSIAPYYSSVHRGTGFKSRLCTRAYERAHEIIAEFVGADLSSNTVIFVKNATEAINKLAHRLKAPRNHVVITTAMEHHSNDLPWRYNFETVYVRTTPEGRLDEDHFDSLLREYEGRIAIVAVTGASNVTGYIQPVHHLAEKVHRVGARILVDAAQLAPHRKIDMRPDNDPGHLDFIAIAGHKMYAPYGTGALIGPKSGFMDGPPDYCGGGTVRIVTLDEVYWADMPDKDEAGSPNVLGAIAMAIAAETLMEKGMENIAEHERDLTAYTLDRMRSTDGITVYGETDPSRASEKVGVIPFNINGTDHSLAASIIGYEGGIGVRNGCFCAHPYVVNLLKLDESETARWRVQFLGGDKSEMPGMIRMSFGCYSNREDVDRLFEAIEMIQKKEYSGKYFQVPETGEFLPENYEDDFTGFWKYPVSTGH